MVPAHWWVELSLVTLVGRAAQSGMSRGMWAQEDFLSSLSADGWGYVPALLVVWPEASQHWGLQAVGWGQVSVRKWQPPEGLTPMSIPQNYCRQCLCPHNEPQPPPHLCRRPSDTNRVVWPVSYEIAAFFPESWCLRLCVSPLRVAFLLHPVLWNSCDQPSLAFKAKFSGGSSS